MKYKAIIFDLDGTLVNTSIDLSNAVNYALKKAGYHPVDLSVAVKNTGNGMFNLIKRSIPEEVDYDSVSKIYEEFKEYYSYHYLDYSTRYDGIEELLKQIKELGLKLAVISNKRNEYTLNIINTLYPHMFDSVIGEIDGIKIKPNPDLIDITLDKLNVSKDEVLFVGDSEVDYKTAINSDVDYLIVTYGFRSKEYLESLGINRLIESPSDVLKYIR